MVVTDDQSRAVWVNEAMVQISGYRAEEIVGRRPDELFRHPETDPDVADHVDTHVTTREPFTVELLNRHRDGHPYWIRISCTPLVEKGQFSGYVAIQTDVTERRRAEAALKLQEDRFRALVQSSSDVMSILDAEGRIAYESPAAKAVLGYEPEELVGHSASEFIHERDIETATRAFAAAVSTPGRAVSVSFRWRHSDGSWVDLEAVGTSRLDDPAVQGVVFNSRDVSTSLRYEAEREARLRAEEMLRLKAAFLSNMSHEIRTPLTAILGSGEILADEVGPELQDFADAVCSGGERLMRTLTSVLDLAQIEAGEMHPQSRPVDVAAHLDATVQALRPLADDKGLLVRLDVEEGLPVVSLDPCLLDRIVTNLVGNAIKFTEDGSVKVRARYGGDHLVLEVSDTGIGMDPTSQERLFNPFQQASEGRNRSHEGNGLGLAIVRNVTELMGGQVTVASVLGEGSRFRVSIPVAVADEDREAVVRDGPASGEQRIEMATDDLAVGTYVVRATTMEGVTATARLTVVR